MRACVVIPVLNEEAQLVDHVSRVRDALMMAWAGGFSLVVADNGSTDRTLSLARSLAQKYPEVDAVRVKTRGRGAALRAVWSSSDAEVLAYMDVDLSTDLGHLPALLGAVASGECDLAVGSRLVPGSEVARGWRREMLSRCYNTLLALSLGLRVRDAQCGFKAIAAHAARRLLPMVRDNRWFFDTELLCHAQWQGLRIKEIPVRWVDDPDSRVWLCATAVEDLRGIWRLRGQRR